MVWPTDTNTSVDRITTVVIGQMVNLVLQGCLGNLLAGDEGGKEVTRHLWYRGLMVGV